MIRVQSSGLGSLRGCGVPLEAENRNEAKFTTLYSWLAIGLISQTTTKLATPVRPFGCSLRREYNLHIQQPPHLLELEPNHPLPPQPPPPPPTKKMTSGASVAVAAATVDWRLAAGFPGGYTKRRVHRQRFGGRWFRNLAA